MKPVRAIVKQRLKELDWTAYRLAKEVKGRIVPQTIYSFLNGSREMSTKNLHHVLNALGLEIRPKQ